MRMWLCLQRESAVNENGLLSFAAHQARDREGRDRR